MNANIVNKLLISVLLINFSLAAPLAIAGPDAFQQQMTQQLLKAKQKQKEVEAAKGAERQKLMDEHMTMLHASMQKCAAMKPKAGMSEQERDEWYSEHQQLMDQMMEQMMQDHRMMMDMSNMHK
jgi:Ni/Co efflux regulator RcnB